MSSTLVRYGVRGVARRAPYYGGLLRAYLRRNYRPRINMGAARFAIRAAGRVRRAYGGRMRARKRQKFSTKNVGEAPGTSNAKRNKSVETSGNRNSRTLYSEQLIEIPQGQDLDQREQHAIKVSGFKICMEIRNLANMPLYCNFAILSPKETSTISTADFFRRTAGNSRAEDFDTTLSANEMHCSGINTDKYTVLWHKRRSLVALASGGNTVSLTGKSWMNLNFYKKIQRQVRFDSSTATSPTNGKVFFVYWFDLFGALGASPALTSVATVSLKTVCYFRDSKVCGC